MRTKLEIILIIVMVIAAIGAVLQGMRTLNTLNRMEKAMDTLANIACEALDEQNYEPYPVIDWEKMELHCQKDGKIEKTIPLLEVIQNEKKLD